MNTNLQHFRPTRTPAVKHTTNAPTTPPMMYHKDMPKHYTQHFAGNLKTIYISKIDLTSPLFLYLFKLNKTIVFCLTMQHQIQMKSWMFLICTLGLPSRLLTCRYWQTNRNWLVELPIKTFNGRVTIQFISSITNEEETFSMMIWGFVGNLVSILHCPRIKAINCGKILTSSESTSTPSFSNNVGFSSCWF